VQVAAERTPHWSARSRVDSPSKSSGAAAAITDALDSTSKIDEV